MFLNRLIFEKRTFQNKQIDAIGKGCDRFIKPSVRRIDERFFVAITDMDRVALVSVRGFHCDSLNTG